MERTTDLRKRLPEYTASGNQRRQLESMERGGRRGGGEGGEAASGRQVVVGWPSSGLRVLEGWAPLAAGWFPEGAGGRGMGAAGRGARPRDGGPGQGHTAPGADSLAGAAPRPGAESAPRAGPHGLSFPGAEPGPAGAWSSRAGGGPGPVTCGKRRRASPLCPAGWSSSRPRSRSPSRASGRRAATRLRPSPRRAEPGAGPPRGEARGDTAAGRGSQPPRRRTARWRRPPPRRQSPAVGTPRVSGTQSLKHPEWLCPRFEALGVSRGTRAGGPYSDMVRRPVRTARWPRLRVRAHGGLTSSPRGLSAHLRLLPPPRWVVAGLLGEHAEGRRGTERTSRTLRAGLLRTSRWQLAHIHAHFRPRPRPGLALAAARRVALRTRRTDAVFSRRPEQEDGRR